MDVVTSAIESVGALSSSVIVSVAVSSEKEALIALERVIVAVSLLSSVESVSYTHLTLPTRLPV